VREKEAEAARLENERQKKLKQDAKLHAEFIKS
jgi:hypothetical protein